MRRKGPSCHGAVVKLEREVDRSNMRNERAEAVKKILGESTRKGETEINGERMKKVKEALSGEEPETMMRIIWEYLFKKLRTSSDSQVRLPTFLVLDYFFRRSKDFRVLTLRNLEILISSTLGSELPPPEAGRKALKKLAQKSIGEWRTSFGKKYPSLESASSYLKDVQNIDVDSHLRERREESLKIMRLWRDRVETVRNEIEEMEPQILEVVTLIKNGIDYLIPPLVEEEEQQQEEKEPLDNDSEDELIRPNGLLNLTQSVTSVNLALPSFLYSDNEALVDNLRDHRMLLSNRLLPAANKWNTILDKAGDHSPEDLKQKVLKILEELRRTEHKIDGLNLPKRNKPCGSDDEDDSDEFEDVPEKDGYEEDVVEPLLDFNLMGTCRTMKKKTKEEKPKKARTSIKKKKNRYSFEKKIFNRSSLNRVRKDINSRLMERNRV